MSEPLVQYTIQGSTAIIALNRSDRRNAISRGLIAALSEAFVRAREDSAARAVILTGNGPSFCAGMDLAELQETIETKIEGGAIWDDVHQLAHLYDLIYTLPKPTIAAVNGAAVAGGAGLVTVCDLALAVPAAKFGYPEVRRGLVAALVMPHLLRHVGERAARYLLLTGELYSAEDAVRTGLINAVVPASQLLETARQWAHAIAEGGPMALAQTKALLHRFSGQAVSLEETTQASAAPRLTDECRHGLQAFFAKQPAPWAPRPS
ncbi:MAG: enoyl-CoA hydratase/isomerase family protein [Gemmataceae bacterium]|nr:enoyl-CoA hydratase/isomerase family protein [Gemmataceae bacterium]